MIPGTSEGFSLLPSVHTGSEARSASEPLVTMGILAGVKASPGRETVPSIPLSAKVTNA